MPTFKYRSKGTNSEDWAEGNIVATDEDDAIKTLDETYGIKRDDKGNQTNSDLIKVELVK